MLFAPYFKGPSFGDDSLRSFFLGGRFGKSFPTAALCPAGFKAKSLAVAGVSVAPLAGKR